MDLYSKIYGKYNIRRREWIIHSGGPQMYGIHWAKSAVLDDLCINVDRFKYVEYDQLIKVNPFKKLK